MSREHIYWDADPFLGWLQEETGKVDLCRGTIDEAQRGNVLIVTSALTLAEALYQKRQQVVGPDRKDKVIALFCNEFIAVRNVTRAIAELAREFCWSHGVDHKDAIHVATAVALKVPTFETFDKGLLAQNGKIGNLVIRSPQPPKQGKLL